MPIIYNPDYLMFKNCSDRIIVSERYSCGQSFSQWPSMVTIVIGRDQRVYQNQRPLFKPLFRGLGGYLYESICTLFTALPEGSIMFLNEASHAMASGVLHATDGTDGTHDAAESEGKCSVKMHL